MLFGGTEWEETEILEIQQDKCGNKRAFLINNYRKRKVNYDWITGVLKNGKYDVT